MDILTLLKFVKVMMTVKIQLMTMAEISVTPEGKSAPKAHVMKILNAHSSQLHQLVQTLGATAMTLESISLKKV